MTMKIEVCEHEWGQVNTAEHSLQSNLTRRAQQGRSPPLRGFKSPLSHEGTQFKEQGKRALLPKGCSPRHNATTHLRLRR